MDKARQRYLQQWLKIQQTPIKKSLNFNVLLASLGSVILVGQTYCFAMILQSLIIQQQSRSSLMPYFIGILASVGLRALILYWRERIGFHCGSVVRQHIRQQILDKIATVGPATILQKPAGSWATIMLEQVENLHNFYARYLPQQHLSAIVPVVIMLAVFPFNWAAGLILMLTAPLIPLFMILVGIAAAESSQQNMAVLAKLSAQFLDRLKGLETLRLFNKTMEQTTHIEESTEAFRETTMEVLKKAFLSSSVLEFFTSISIALMAVYFGFSYLGQLDFGSYDQTVSLLAGFFCLSLAPEFYQPLRDLGTYYHDRAAGIGAADAIVDFLEAKTPLCHADHATKIGKIFTHKMQTDFSQVNALSTETTLKKLVVGTSEWHFHAKDLVILSPTGEALTAPLNFDLLPRSLTALVGQSGAGKTSLINVLLGFLTYEGSLQINGQELRELALTKWRKEISWVGQNPVLLHGTIRENLLLGETSVSEQALHDALTQAQALDFVLQMGLDHEINENGGGLSVGQAQRLAIARAILRRGKLVLLDEPTASLDANAENLVLHALENLSRDQTTLMVTHRIEDLKQCDNILVMKAGQIVQQGCFDELKNTGYFAELLAQRQQDIQ